MLTVCTGSGSPGIFFHFTKNWKNENAIKLLKDFKGNLQTDGYSGYKKVGKRPDVKIYSQTTFLNYVSNLIIIWWNGIFVP